MSLVESVWLAKRVYYIYYDIFYQIFFNQSLAKTITTTNNLQELTVFQ